MVNDIIKEAYEGDTEAINQIDLALKFQKAMQHLFENINIRDALIIIARRYGGCSLQRISKIFSMTHPNVFAILGKYNANA